VGPFGDKARECKNSDNAKNYGESTHGFYGLNKLRQQRGRRLVANFATSSMRQLFDASPPLREISE
jgi:hypothetical protein